MKKLIFTLCALWMVSSSLWAKFEVDGIYYNITNETDKKVEVTYRGNYLSSHSTYWGNVIIPTSINYNNSVYTVTSIGEHAFRNCQLDLVTIPNSVTSIGEYAFSLCTGLTSITIPNSVTSIENCAFVGCTGLTEITIPESVTSIEMYAFGDCTGLTTVNYNATNCTRMGKENQSVFSNCTNLTTLNIGENVTRIPSYAFINCTGLTNVTIPNSITIIEYKAFLGCRNLFNSYISTTQATIRTKLFSTFKGVTTGVFYNDCFYPANENGIAIINGLSPNTQYSFSGGIQLANGTYCGLLSSKSQTQNLNPQIRIEESTPLSFSCTGSYTKGDAEVVKTGFTGYESDGKNLMLTGLNPETKYTVRYYVESKGGYREEVSHSFTTPAVEFTTLPAKATSNTVAVICAETNLSDDAVGAGFEWRRYDAPDLVPSTQSACPVMEGTLTGALRNLSANTYYKFRPYYTSEAGKSYYGEWSAFGTADAYVYFDPTVRTYSATNVTSSSAKVKGYAIAGSDEIVEQGFEYWATNGTTPAVKALSDDGVQSVMVTGQYMTTTLQNLLPSTEYTYRAYIKTAKSVTYGSEESFRTGEAPSGIDDVTGESITVAIHNGAIVVMSIIDTPSTIEVYSINGQLVYRGIETTIPINVRGIYLVRIGNKVTKVIV